VRVLLLQQVCNTCWLVKPLDNAAARVLPLPAHTPNTWCLAHCPKPSLTALRPFLTMLLPLAFNHICWPHVLVTKCWHPSLSLLLLLLLHAAACSWAL
jgi:hypothetical protein